MKTPLNCTQELQHLHCRILIFIALYREILKLVMRPLLYSFLSEATWHLSCVLCVTSFSGKLTGFFRASWRSTCFATDQRYLRPGPTYPDISRSVLFWTELSVCLSVCLFVCLSVCEFCSYWDADTYKKSGLRYNLFTKQSWCPYFTPPHQEWGKIGWGIIRWGIIGGTLIIPENISYHYIWQY